MRRSLGRCQRHARGLALRLVGTLHSPGACRVSIVMEHFIRMLQACGLPAGDCDLIHGNGKVVNELLLQAQPRNTLFTGSGKIAEKLALDLKRQGGPPSWLCMPTRGSLACRAGPQPRPCPG